ncbi:MAG: radical SAM protein [Deltaproteobacteria bacterium]|nr:radical SAM protein [Deltaproteobacteria bacterium]
MRRIVLVEPKPPGLNVFSAFKLPRLGPIILGTILARRGFEVRVFVEQMGLVDDSALAAADLVGISTVTSTAPRSYELARDLRRRGIKVVMGGPHVTFLPDEALLHCDYVLRGEAEDSIVELVEALRSGTGLLGIAGLSFRAGGTVHHNPDRSAPTDLDSVPLPDFGLVQGSSALKGLSFKRCVPVQISRGCPHACTFCCVTPMFGRKVRVRPVEGVMREIEAYDPRDDFIFFYDDNFAADPAYAKSLLRAMLASGRRFRWSAQVRAEAAEDAELLGLMRDAGCEHVYVGFETTSDEALAAVRKGQTLEGMTRAVRAMHAHEITIHGMFVLGFDEDTFEGARKTCEWAMREKLRTVQYLLLTPLPGSRLFREMEAAGRLLTRDWSRYDGHHVVHEPARMTPAELQRAQIFGHEHYCSLKERLRSLARLDFYRLAVQVYGRKLNATWMRENREYLERLGIRR